MPQENSVQNIFSVMDQWTTKQADEKFIVQENLLQIIGLVQVKNMVAVVMVSCYLILE